MVRSFRKQVADSRVLGRGRHQVVHDYHVSYSGIEVVIAVQVGRDASDEFHPRNHRPTYLIIEGLPSLVQPDDFLRRWHHLGATSSVLTKYVFPHPVGPVMFAVNG